MSPELLGGIMLALMLLVIFIGFPISFTLMLLALIFGWLGLGDRAFYILVFQTIGLMKEEVLAAVPLFIFMGYLMEQGGLMERLFKGFQLLMGPVPGSLYVGVLITATIFGIAAGTVGATVVLMGIMAVPIMTKAGYDIRMSAGAITAGGTLGILVPPSVMLVVMGPVMGVSVADLYLSCFIPGFLLAGIFIVYCLVRSFLNPSLGPPLPPEERSGSLLEILKELTLGMLPHLILILATLGTIVWGWATPTEAAAMGVVGAAFLALIYREFTWRRLKDAVYNTLLQSSTVLFLAVAGNVFGAVFSRLGTATVATNAMLGWQIPAVAMLAVIMVIIFLLGWPFEWPAIILVFVPLMQPVIAAMKIDMLWFATLIAVNLQTAFLSPPVAMSAYYLKGVAPQWDLGDIYHGMAQFMVLQLVGLGLCIAFPDIVLWLPRMVFGK
ncbi:MAG: TRAP transporter large permease subunit [Candidatus Rokubacteria bacterium]|nr:TRAP transporter large permease subunit [Candidatus Rokubacteria bacterium]